MRDRSQGRLATHLRGLNARQGMASDAMRRTPDVARPSTHEAGDGDPRVIFSECPRVLDSATLEFSRGYGPHVALSLSSAT